MTNFNNADKRELELQQEAFEKASSHIWDEDFKINDEDEITLKRMVCLGGVAIKSMGILSEYDPELWQWVQDQIIEDSA